MTKLRQRTQVRQSARDAGESPPARTPAAPQMPSEALRAHAEALRTARIRASRRDRTGRCPTFALCTPDPFDRPPPVPPSSSSRWPAAPVLDPRRRGVRAATRRCAAGRGHRRIGLTNLLAAGGQQSVAPHVCAGPAWQTDGSVQSRNTSIPAEQRSGSANAAAGPFDSGVEAVGPVDGPEARSDPPRREPNAGQIGCRALNVQACSR